MVCRSEVSNLSAWLGGVRRAVNLYGASGTFGVGKKAKIFVTHDAWYKMYINGCFVLVHSAREVTKTVGRSA